MRLEARGTTSTPKPGVPEVAPERVGIGDGVIESDTDGESE